MLCVFLMERPRGVSTAHTLHKGVWQVVCLAVINAMDLGRRAACQLGVQQHAAAAAAITVAAPQWGQLRITWVMATYKIADCTRYIPYPISHN
jgi:hypothetical protein